MDTYRRDQCTCGPHVKNGLWQECEGCRSYREARAASFKAGRVLTEDLPSRPQHRPRVLKFQTKDSVREVVTEWQRVHDCPGFVPGVDAGRKQGLPSFAPIRRLFGSVTNYYVACVQWGLLTEERAEEHILRLRESRKVYQPCTMPTLPSAKRQRATSR
jgi:hypothetical protein